MKLLFLDIDGVLNGHEKLPSGYCGIRHELASRFNRILDSVPDVQIVVSSAWRYMMLRGDMQVKGFEYLLLVHGVKCHNRVHGHTVADGAVCDEPDHSDVERWKLIGLKMRAAQINLYMQSVSVTTFVVLDDLPLDVPNLVQTCGETGLREPDVDRAIAYLNCRCPHLT